MKPCSTSTYIEDANDVRMSKELAIDEVLAEQKLPL